MTTELRRLATACLTIAGIWFAFLAGAGLLLDAGWAVWRSTSDEHYNIAMRAAFDLYLLIVWIGLLPSWILCWQKVRAQLVYLIAGIGSALLATYALLFSADFGVPLAFSTTRPPMKSDLAVRVFTEVPRSFNYLFDPDSYLLGVCIALGISGAFWGMVGWRLFRPAQ